MAPPAWCELAGRAVFCFYGLLIASTMANDRLCRSAVWLGMSAVSAWFAVYCCRVGDMRGFSAGF